MDYYRDAVTQRSWETLMALQKAYSFVLIGGWAVWLYTRRLKSKDIDLVIAFPELAKLKERYALAKNDRLKKYEAVEGPVQIDVYVPHWSVPGIPAEDLLTMAVSKEGFRVAPPEALLVTKQVAYASRAGTIKGRKDLVDIVSLLQLEQFDWSAYRAFAKRFNPTLPITLSRLLKEQTSIPEFGLNPHTFSRQKKEWLSRLGTIHA